jgi:hypothetical protein
MIVIDGSNGITGPQSDNDTTINGVTVGKGAGSVATNTAVGASALQANTSASRFTAVGYNAGINATGSYNTVLGSYALAASTSGTNNTAIGDYALNTNTGSNNTAVGQGALVSSGTPSGSNNTGLGVNAIYYNQTGNYNTAVGSNALFNNTTASNNTAVGYQAGYSQTTGGTSAGYNAYFGQSAGYASTGYQNTLIGRNAGSAITSGNSNTLIGQYNGNQGGLDIRLLSNYIVLSDGDGNPRGIFDGSGNYIVGGTLANNNNSTSFGFNVANGNQFCNHINGTTSGTGYIQFSYNGTVIGSITQSGTTAVLYNTTSDYRLKSNVQPVTSGLSVINQLNPVNFTWISDNEADTGFLAHEFQAIIPRAVTGAKDAVDADGKPVYQQMDNSGAIPYLVAAIKELKAEFDSYKATHP